MAIASSRLRACGLFATTAETALQQLSASCTEVVLQAGAAFWLAGAPAHAFLLVERGLVQTNRESPRGSIELVALFGPGDAVGLPSALRGAVTSWSTLAATREVVAIRVPASAFRGVVAADPALAQALISALVTHTERLRAKIFIVSAGSVEARVASLLLHLAERFVHAGGESRTGRVQVPISLSRSAIAGLVSTRPETISRTLKHLRDQGIVESVEGGFDVDLDALRSVVGRG